MAVNLADFLPFTPNEAARFIRKIAVGDHGCWIWTGGKSHGNSKSRTDRGGYGKFYLRGHTVLANRLLWWATNGSIAGTLDHLPTCDRACVNPRHSEDVPIVVNVMRGNGVMARNARKTHCKRGHPLSGRNLVQVPGGRMCRICRNLSYGWYHQRKKVGVS